MSTHGSKVNPNRPNAGMLLWAYRQGIFPMGDPTTDRVDWYSPDPRAILPLDEFHVPKSLARVVRKGKFEISSDRCFREVIESCAKPRTYERLTWITQPLVDAYCELHLLGHAHSVEAWLGGQLVGGLYGVHIGGAFFGESMFTRADRGGRDASKVCLVHLVAAMRRAGMLLLDTQFTNDHIAQFGSIEIEQTEYMTLLHTAIDQPVDWADVDVTRV